MTRRAWMAGSVGAAVFFGASASWAGPGFALDRFNPAEAGSEWFALDTLDLRGGARPALSIQSELARRPLAAYGANGALLVSLVENQAFAHFTGSLILLDRVRLALSFPVAFYQNGKADELSGTGYAAPSHSAAAADLRVGADARLVGVAGKAFTLAAGVQLFIPTGSRSQYTGDGSLRLLPRALIAGEVGLFAYAAQVGFQYRALSQNFGSGKIGSEALLGFAAGVRLAEKRLLIGPEFFGSTVVSNSSSAFGKIDTPSELLVGVHYRFPVGLRIGAGGGFGLSRGLGTPQARFVASLGWEPEAAPGESDDEPPDPGGVSIDEGKAAVEMPVAGDSPGPKDAPLGLDLREQPPAPAGAARAKPRPASKPATDESRIQSPKIHLGGPAAEREKAPEIHQVLNPTGPKARAGSVQERQAVDGKAALEPAVIAETIGKNAMALQACIDTELRRNPGFKGAKFLITAHLKPSGIVASASINKPEVDGSVLGACLKEKARRIVFPAFEGSPFDLEIPFELTSGE